MAKDWLRIDPLQRIEQNQKFCEGVLRHQGPLNLNSSEVTEVIRDLQWSSYYLAYWGWLERELHAAELRAKVKHEKDFPVDSPPSANLLPKPPSGAFAGTLAIPLIPEPLNGIDVRFRALVRTIKASEHYTPAIGAELDILVPPSPANPSTAQPKLKVQTLGGGAIQFTVRPMKFSAVQFQCRVAGSASFLTIAKSKTGKLTWNAPGPFPRALEVRARFENDHQPVGLPCPVMPVIVSA